MDYWEFCTKFSKLSSENKADILKRLEALLANESITELNDEDEAENEIKEQVISKDGDGDIIGHTKSVIPTNDVNKRRDFQMFRDSTLVTVDELGRIVVPQVVRREIGINAKDSLQVSYDADSKIIMIKPEPSQNND